MNTTGTMTEVDFRHMVMSRLDSIEEQLCDMENYGFGAPEGEPLQELSADDIDLRDDTTWWDQCNALTRAYVKALSLTIPGGGLVNDYELDITLPNGIIVNPGPFAVFSADDLPKESEDE